MKRAVILIFISFLCAVPLFSDSQERQFAAEVVDGMDAEWQYHFENELVLLLENQLITSYTFNVTTAVLKDKQFPDDPVISARLVYFLVRENDIALKKGMPVAWVKATSATVWHRAVSQKKLKLIPAVDKDLLKKIKDDNKDKLDKDLKIKDDKVKVKNKINDKLKK